MEFSLLNTAHFLSLALTSLQIPTNGPVYDCFQFHTRTKCAIWMIIQTTVFWTMCTQICIAMRNLNCAIQMFVRRCFLVTHVSKSCRDVTVWLPWPLNCNPLVRATWPSNHFRLYTARCTCSDAHETRAPRLLNFIGVPRHEPCFFICSEMLQPQIRLLSHAYTSIIQIMQPRNLHWQRSYLTLVWKHSM